MQPTPRNLDRWLHAQWGRLTGGLSPNAVQLAFTDWGLHLLDSPAHCMALWQDAWALSARWMLNNALSPQQTAHPIALPQDHRFHLPQWERWPWRMYRDLFVIAHHVVTQATSQTRGVSSHHQQVVNFTCHQGLDLLSPANFAMTNPVVVERTLQTGGMNLLCGAVNWWQDSLQALRGDTSNEPNAFVVGQQVAVTPGVVVLRNRLIELIQYSPQTGTVQATPVLLVPAWIMKFYILDLSPHNSLVKYLVDQGHTVFMISWVNPTEADRDISMDDYLQLGVMAAIDTITRLTAQEQVHAAGYCLGGTLLAIAAAAMGRDRDTRLASMTLLAAQTDFTEPGDLGLFIDESQVTLLEDSMWETGYLDRLQMAGSFKLTQSNDRVWAIWLRDYLLGERHPPSDLASWNLDSTRLPYHMHTEYLRHLYLGNDLAQGRYIVGTQPVALADIICPIFCVGTESDTVAPWHSVYKIQLYTAVDSTFVLSSGGHNVGIVNPPDTASDQQNTDGAGVRRHYRIRMRYAGEPWMAATDWKNCVNRQSGSWWPEWANWLKLQSTGTVPADQRQPAAQCPNNLGPAPGRYVLQK